MRVVIEHFGESGQDVDLLEKLPFDFIKVDGSLITDITRNVEHQREVSRITARVRELGGVSIGALVQDASSLAVLFQCGIDYIQGYFMQAPSDVFSMDETLE